jgi:hypothetical protein
MVDISRSTVYTGFIVNLGQSIVRLNVFSTVFADYTLRARFCTLLTDLTPFPILTVRGNLPK